MRIAALKDEAGEIDSIRQAIEGIGHECIAFDSEALLLAGLRRHACDLLMLDLQLPDLARLRLVRRLREEFGSRLPILTITASSSDQDMIDALGAGADDFMAKPLRMPEMQARLNALLRRCYPHLDETVLNFGPYRFFLSNRTLQVRGEPIALKMREYDLALYLFKHVGRLLSREHLLDAVWGTTVEGPTRSLDTHMSRLRTKLGLRPSNGVLLSAAYGLGYRLEFINSDGFGPSPVAAEDEAEPAARSGRSAASDRIALKPTAGGPRPDASAARAGAPGLRIDTRDTLADPASSSAATHPPMQPLQDGTEPLA